MTREEAINKVRWGLMGLVINKDVRDAFEMLIPELRESEDERIRKGLIEVVSDIAGGWPFEEHKITKKEALAYLEKQKMQKPTSFSEPYNPDEHEVVIEGNATSLKQKEQKPVDYDHEMWKNCEANFEGGKKEVIEHPEKYGLQKAQKPTATINGKPIPTENHSVDIPLAEWSEEDERIIKDAIYALEEAGGYPYTVKGLKSLRPQSNWKPSEEQMEAFRSYIKDFQEKAEVAVGGWNNFDVMIQLFEQLKKL